ncbi:type III secretion apparatus needle protein [Methylobacterium phyllostachyos]|uniref:Type III secretion apparatus needle protein n=1 Tax=Methylobacterium phyllostachyos TaxID=582672 RepID=A0A1H0HN01_9HYPH|nr:EscF/YscF/HrpA family type III secretion system needle major subunit [Methylobacterium phyllostachyos]SDO20444.1 type III secretion apparatus needle protein [Methylobacterium phyllostachyos]
MSGGTSGTGATTVNPFGTYSFWTPEHLNNPRNSDYSTTPYETYDGFDLIWRQNYLQGQMKNIENDIRSIEKNSNLSDTEKMFSMQMAMNSWSAISNLRTNMLKSVSDTLKSIARNVA